MTYTCALCGGTFKSERSPTEAVAEAYERYGRVDLSTLPIICDDCDAWEHGTMRRKWESLARHISEAFFGFVASLGLKRHRRT